MKNMIETLATLNNEQTKAFYKSLESKGFTNTEIKAIQTQVFIYKLHTNETFYNIVMESTMETYLNEIA